MCCQMKTSSPKGNDRSPESQQVVSSCPGRKASYKTKENNSNREKIDESILDAKRAAYSVVSGWI